MVTVPVVAVPTGRRAFLGFVTVALFLLPAAASQSAPDQIHVTLAGTVLDAAMQPPEATQLVVHWSVATPYGPQLKPQVKYRIGNGTELVAMASLVGSPRDTSPPQTTAEHDLTPVYAARIVVPRGKNMTYQAGEPSAGFSAPRTVGMVPNRVNETTVVALSSIGYAGYSRTTGLRFPAEAAPQEAAVRLALNQTPDLALLLGNLGMSSSGKPWSGFMRGTEPLQSTVATVPVPGEQDSDEDQYQFRERYVLPYVKGTAGAAVQETEYTYHAYTAGPAYFLGLDTTRLCIVDSPGPAATASPPVYPCARGRPDTAYLAWIHDVLEDAREDIEATWIIVYMGLGPYAYADDGDPIIVQKLLVPLFESYNVDLVLHASENVYQRTYPLRGGLPVSKEGPQIAAGQAPVYVMVGPAGSSAIQPISKSLPSWLAVSNSSRMVTRLDISPTAINVTALVAATGEVADQFILTKSSSSVSPTPGTPSPKARSPGLEVGLLLLGLLLVVRRRLA